MRWQWFILVSSAAALFLPSCTNSLGGAGNGPTMATGPFDSRGNYVEAWADTPSKWRARRTVAATEEPAPDRPAMNVPVTPSQSIAANRSSADDEERRPSTTASRRREVEVANTRTRTTASSRETASTKSRSTREATVASSGRSKTTASASRSRNTEVASRTSKTTAGKKATASTRTSSSSRYSVRSGDSLNAIAKRYGTTASALQRANGLKGTMIHPGQSLVVPKS